MVMTLCKNACIRTDVYPGDEMFYHLIEGRLFPCPHKLGARMYDRSATQDGDGRRKKEGTHLLASREQI